MVDLSTPEQPVMIGLWGEWTPGPGMTKAAVAVADGYAYVSGKNLVIVDISDPTRPVDVAEVGLPGHGLDVAVWDDQVSVAAGDTLHFIDASNPRAPVERGTWSAEDHRLDAWGVATSGRYAYTFGGTGDVPQSWGLRVFDVSDPARPVLVGSDGVGWYIQDVAASGSHLYIVSMIGGFRVVDVSDPTSPTDVGALLGSVTSPSVRQRLADVEVVGDHAFVAGDFGLTVVDVSDPTSPTRTGVLPGVFFSVEVRGDYAYVADESGLRVVDVSTPSQPVEVGSKYLPGGAQSVQVSNGHAYLVRSGQGDDALLVVDVSSPDSPRLLRTLPLGNRGPARRDDVVSVSVDRALVALGESSDSPEGGGNLLVLDVSDPSNPLHLAWLATPGQAAAVVIAGERAFLADGTAGLAVYDAAECLGADPAPSLRIAAATFGTTLANRTPVSVAVDGFELDCDGPVEPGRGRWQLWVDDTLDSEACTSTAVLAGWYPEGQWHSLVLCCRSSLPNIVRHKGLCFLILA